MTTSTLAMNGDLASAPVDAAYWSYVSCPTFAWNAVRRLSDSLLKDQREYNKTKQKPRIKMKFKKIKTNEILDLLEDGAMVAHGSADGGYTVYKMIKFPDGALKVFEQEAEENALVDHWMEVEEIEFDDLLSDEWYKASV